MKSLDINLLFKCLRLYADLNVPTILHESASDFLAQRYEQLNSQGFVDALISVKMAQTDALKSAVGELEQMLEPNIQSFDITQLADLMITYNTVSQFKQEKAQPFPNSGGYFKKRTHDLI